MVLNYCLLLTQTAHQTTLKKLPKNFRTSYCAQTSSIKCTILKNYSMLYSEIQNNVLQSLNNTNNSYCRPAILAIELYLWTSNSNADLEKLFSQMILIKTTLWQYLNNGSSNNFLHIRINELTLFTKNMRKSLV